MIEEHRCTLNTCNVNLCTAINNKDFFKPLHFTKKNKNKITWFMLKQLETLMIVRKMLCNVLEQKGNERQGMFTK